MVKFNALMPLNLFAWLLKINNWIVLLECLNNVFECSAKNYTEPYLRKNPVMKRNGKCSLPQEGLLWFRVQNFSKSWLFFSFSFTKFFWIKQKNFFSDLKHTMSKVTQELPLMDFSTDGIKSIDDLEDNLEMFC